MQKLAADGILLPPEVIESRLDSCVLHMDVGRAADDEGLRLREPAEMHRDLQADPSLALRIMEKLARRVRDREAALVRMGNQSAQGWGTGTPRGRRGRPWPRR